MSALKRQISENISDQQVEGTCYAHSIARIILNAIRQTIPEYFYPMESDLCNNIYWTGIFSNLERHITEYKCGEHSTNNILLFAYIYKSITDKYGCEGEFTETVFEWYIKTFMKTDFGTEQSISSTLGNLSEPLANKVKTLCNAFSVRFYREQGNDFVFQSQKIKDITDFNIVKYVLDNGYYIGVHGEGHIVTAVGYKEHLGHTLLILKNSWGKLTSFDKKLKAPISQGISTMTIDKIVEAGFDRISYILPNILSDQEVERVRRRNVMNELLERNMRKMYNLTRRGGKRHKRKSRKNKRKTKRTRY